MGIRSPRHAAAAGGGVACDAPTADDLRAAFAEPSPMTVGLEEEVMLLDARTLDLAPRAAEVLGALDGDERFKLELPAAQLEIATPPTATVAEAGGALAAARADLLRAVAPQFRLAAAGAHPFAAPEGVVSDAPRYRRIEAEFGAVARHQLVFGLHVHVAVRPADRALAVYNATRSHLPDLAALAANAPFYAGRAAGLASVRPKIAELLPRQGVPPEIVSFEALAEELRWGRASGAVAEPRQWWFELRPHVEYGTVEVRVPDVQVTVADTGAVAAVAHCLIARLAERHAAGERLPVAATWRVAQNRWSACRHGLDGRLADLRSGAPLPARERLAALLDELAPVADRLGCAAELAHARALAPLGASVRHSRPRRRTGVPVGRPSRK